MGLCCDFPFWSYSHSLIVKTSGLSLQNTLRLSTIIPGWSYLKKTFMFSGRPLCDLLTSKWEHKKALCHWKNERVMGQWLTCCLGPRDRWGTRGLPWCLYPQNCYTIYGLSWVCMGPWFMTLHLVLSGHCCRCSGRAVKDDFPVLGRSRGESRELTCG